MRKLNSRPTLSWLSSQPTKRAAKRLARALFRRFAHTPPTLRLYNAIFERSPHWLANKLNSVQSRPDFDLIWTVRLLTGKKLKVPVHRSNPRSWEFSHAYHWHDIGIRNLEHALFSNSISHNRQSVFLDIGANMGLRSLLPLSLGIRSFLFEPNRELRSYSEEVFAANELTNFEIINLGVSDRTGWASFYLSETTYMSSLIREWVPPSNPVREVRVAITTLDDWLLSQPDLADAELIIKIDVEGSELSVLQGAIATMRDRRPTLIVEIAQNTNQRERMGKFCNSVGYRIFAIKESDNLVLIPLGNGAWQEDFDLVNFLLLPQECQLSRIIGTRGTNA